MKKLFDHLVMNQITPNGLLVLHSTYNNYSYINYINFRHEQMRLAMEGYLSSEKVDGITKYTITDKGLHIVREAEKIIGKISVAKSKPKIPFEEWEHYIKKYNEMFPKGRKPNSTVQFRTTPKELFARFKWFFSEYPEYTWEDVLYATEKYVDTYNEQNDYTYMQISKYFVKKDDKHRNTTSALATMCYNIAEGNDVEIDTGTHYFGP